MWTCPKCKQKFVNVNQSHSCGNYTVEDFLKGHTEKAIGLFHDFLAAYKKIGDYELHPVKTRVALVKKMRFCAINKLGRDFIAVHLVLTELHDSDRFFKVENLANRFFVHHVRIFSNTEIDPELKKFMKLAYAVGDRQHVKKI
jgi:hypothetical protein